MFILSIALTGLFASCKKSSSSPSYSMSATIGGTGKNFNVIPPVAQTITVGPVTAINITGVLNASTGESMILQLDNSNGGGPIVAGKYADSSSLFDLSATYVMNLGTEYDAGSAVWSCFRCKHHHPSFRA
jgi:hypothetical protein